MDIQILGLKWLVVSVRKHEYMRAALISKRVAVKLADLIRQYLEDPEANEVYKGKHNTGGVLFLIFSRSYV